MHHDRETAALALEESERFEAAAQQRSASLRDTVYFAGRLIFGSLFIVSALAKIFRFDMTATVLRDQGMDDANLLLPFAIAVELAGGAFLAAGYKVRRIAVGLMVYLAGITVLVMANLGEPLNANSAISNVGFIGALFMLAAYGAGRPSVDDFMERRSAQRFGA